MIKPQDIDMSAKTDTVSDADRAQRITIELAIDTAIQAAHASGKWPATLSPGRSGWTTVNIEAVLQMYRDAGWHVMHAREITVQHPDVRR